MGPAVCAFLSLPENALDLMQQLHNLADAEADSGPQEGALLREGHLPRVGLARFRNGAHRLKLAHRVLQKEATPGNARAA